MKDFDVARSERLQRERSFRIGGQDFTYRASVAPETLLAWDQRGSAQGADFLKIVDETVIAFLEPGQDEKWMEARKVDVENPLNISDIIDVIQWLFEEQTERNPTGPPSESTNGQETTETVSTDDFSSPDTPTG